MPYVPKPDRLHLADKRMGDDDEVVTPDTPGQLNYAVTLLLDQWLLDHGLSYTNINAAIGVLECAKMELYRRVAVPYEDKKIAENGDVYSKENLT